MKPLKNKVSITLDADVIEEIKELAEKHTQDDIADMLGISQGTVSNSLRRSGKRK